MTNSNWLFNTNDINLRTEKRQILKLITTYLFLPQLLYLLYYIVIYKVLNMNPSDSTVHIIDILVTFITVLIILHQIQIILIVITIYHKKLPLIWGSFL